MNVVGTRRLHAAKKLSPHHHHHHHGPISFLVQNQRILLLVLILLLAGIILLTNIYWDIHHYSRHRQQPYSKHSFFSTAYNKKKAALHNNATASNSQQQQQVIVLQEDVSIQKTPQPCNNNNFIFPEHGCLDNEMVSRIHCQFYNLQIDMTKVHGARMGGEPLFTSSIMGQNENVEYLSYEKGAFIVQEPFVIETTDTTTVPPPLLPLDQQQQHNKKEYWHYMNQVMDALVYHNNHDNATTSSTNKPPIKCDQTWPGLTLFITRYEYVNLYHTMTDWWNTYFTMTAHNHDEQMSLPPKKNNTNVNIVFLDAHPQGNLDLVWEQLFGGKSSFLRQLPGNHICFEQVRFIPAGYTSPLFPNSNKRNDCPLTTMTGKTRQDSTMQFVNHVLNVYNLSHVHRIPGHVVVIDRVPYISHPRSKPSQTERILSNLRQLAMNLPETVMAAAASHPSSKHDHDNKLLSFFSSSSTTRTTTFPKITVNVVTLVNDTMRDQIAAIRQAHVLVANHGAGLTHLLFLDHGAHVIELGCSFDFFVELANKWRGIRHYCQDFVYGGQISDQFWNDNVVQVIARALLATSST